MSFDKVNVNKNSSGNKGWRKPSTNDKTNSHMNSLLVIITG
jgi:hypothetical protein